jgi:hypothetical protein
MTLVGGAAAASSLATLAQEASQIATIQIVASLGYVRG